MFLHGHGTGSLSLCIWFENFDFLLAHFVAAKHGHNREKGTNGRPKGTENKTAGDNQN